MKLGKILAIALGVLLGLLFARWTADASSEWRVAVGTVSFEAHEIAEGYVNIGKHLTLHAPPDSAPVMILRGLQGKDVVVRIEVVGSRVLEKMR